MTFSRMYVCAGRLVFKYCSTVVDGQLLSNHPTGRSTWTIGRSCWGDTEMLKKSTFVLSIKNGCVYFQKRGRERTIKRITNNGGFQNEFARTPTVPGFSLLSVRAHGNLLVRASVIGVRGETNKGVFKKFSQPFCYRI